MARKIFYIGLIILLVIGFSSALQIGISPSELRFEGNIHEKICKELILSSDQEVFFSATDSWSAENYLVKDISIYNLNSNELNLELDYPKEIVVNGKSKLELCINGKNVGRYYGAIIYEANQSVAVGTWIILDLNNNKNYVVTKSNKTIMLESNATNKTKINPKTTEIVMLIFTTTMIMLIQILAVLRYKSQVNKQI